jgi:hypothetical protein
MTIWERIWDEVRAALQVAACFVVMAVVAGCFVVTLTMEYWFPDWQVWPHVIVLVATMALSRLAIAVLD